ncbi:MAG: MotA/TolQ/ExbB proton channel family protein [Flavobacteriaceae bacterium]|nr:MotA/TolQ/ExbB proton channel family protein [Flavobacteriaceae bacterium]MDG2446892.1 MotA/TolQ/ExbB proton channel family protein [Flavobacteriaceae bacterium]
MAIIVGIIGTSLINRFMEGGALFMSLILICLLILIYFTIKSILTLKTNKEISKKMLKHISDSGTLGLALGVMGSFIGLITAFDVLEATGAAEPSILAGGLKVALLSTLFGLFTFSVSKLAILILRIVQK